MDWKHHVDFVKLNMSPYKIQKVKTRNLTARRMFFWKILCAPSVDIITNNGLSEKDEIASGGQAFIIQYSGSCI